MRKINLVLVLTFFSVSYIKAQIFPSDTIKFIRYINDTHEKISIPLTTLYYLHNTSFKDKSGWVAESSLQTDTLKDILLIEMDSDVPPEYWSEYTPGSFLLAFEIKKGTKRIMLDSIQDEIHLINSYATRGINNPIHTIRGLLQFDLESINKVRLDGFITINSIKPITKHEIFFNNALIPNTDYNGFTQAERKYWQQQEEQDRKMFELHSRITETETNFYNSLFNNILYPSNKLKYKLKGQKQREFTLDRSYLIKEADISQSPSENLLELLSSNIFYPIEGDFIVINLHHFFAGKKYVFDDETNYSLLLALPDLSPNEYEFNENSTTKAKLAYWHYGPGGHITESKSAIGKLTITKIDTQVVWGSINIDFTSTDRKVFKLMGDFQLPIVDKDLFIELGRKINKIINE